MEGHYIIYTIIEHCLSLSLCVALIFGLSRPSSGPIAFRNVLKCSTLHTFVTIRFWHFSSAAFIEKTPQNGYLWLVIIIIRDRILQRNGYRLHLRGRPAIHPAGQPTPATAKAPQQTRRVKPAASTTGPRSSPPPQLRSACARPSTDSAHHISCLF